MNKVTAVKHLVNLCADQGLVGRRSELDTAIDEIMGGGAQYDRSFIILLTAAMSENMHGGDEDLLNVLRALKDADLLSPNALKDSTAAETRRVIQKHDKSLAAAWIRTMCTKLVDEHGGLVPKTIQELLAMEIPQISLAVATTVSQEAYGCFYGPVVDRHYGVQMAIALELIDVGQYGCKVGNFL